MGLEGAFVQPRDGNPEVWLDLIYAVFLPRQGQLTYEQLKGAVGQAVGDRAVAFDMPESLVEQGTLWLSDAGLQLEAMRPLEPLEEVVAEQVKIELRRAYLFQRPGNRAIMEPVYVRMEDHIRRQLDSLRQAGMASAAGRLPKSAQQTDDDEMEGAALGQEPPRSEFGRRLDELLIAGLRQCARRMGNLNLEYSPRRLSKGAASPARVKLLAPAETTIEYVYNTDHKLWEMMGKSEDDYQWQNALAGESVDLLGGYWFRVTFPGGRRVRLYKKVGPNDTEIRFPR
jgi:hypothetical protein